MFAHQQLTLQRENFFKQVAHLHRKFAASATLEKYECNLGPGLSHTFRTATDCLQIIQSRLRSRVIFRINAHTVALQANIQLGVTHTTNPFKGVNFIPIVSNVRGPG